MGISKQGSITNFWPDDTDVLIHIASSGGISLSDLMRRVGDKWGEPVSLDDITITAEKIHTSCLTYDLHDPSDHTDFLVIEKH